MSIADVLAADSLDSGLRQFARLLKTGSSSGTATLIRKDGTGFQVRIDAVRLSATRFLGFIVDVSEQERAEAEIADSAEQLVEPRGHGGSPRRHDRAARPVHRRPSAPGHGAGRRDRRRPELGRGAGQDARDGGLAARRRQARRACRDPHEARPLERERDADRPPARRASAALIADIEFGGPVAATVVQHHERLDGSGYPVGLAGAHVLPEARVLAVADVVEAMLSHRPYRAALPLDAAMAELEQGAGVRYDAEVCAVCLRLFREQGFTFSPLSGL